MEQLFMNFLVFLSMQPFGQSCTICSFGSWLPWDTCSNTCGGGRRNRQRNVCCPKGLPYDQCVKNRCRILQNEIWETTVCNQICHNGGVFKDERCKCSNGWTGSCCDTACNDGYYGYGCHQKCTCEHGRCDHVTGNCSCFIGWTGSHCNATCNDGYYGYECHQKCSCKYGRCDHVTGNCSCFIGWIGSHCNIICNNGYYGYECLQKCTCEHGSCDHMTGNCNCYKGWTGQQCNNTCNDGYYGYGCHQKCTCEHGRCDHVTGNCSCFIGWTGSHCNATCNDGYYGYGCHQKCTCEHGRCDHVTGNCSCFIGWTGSHCNATCSPGYFGQDCKELCTCDNGYCDHVTGNCTCMLDWIGNSCNISSILQITVREISTEVYVWIACAFVLLLVFVIAVTFFKKQNYHCHCLNSETLGNQNPIFSSCISGTEFESENPYHEYTVIEEQQRQPPASDQTVRYEFLKGSEDYEEVEHYMTIPGLESSAVHSVMMNKYESLLRDENEALNVYLDVNQYAE